MMLDIAADHSYGRFNIKFAQIAGLNAAVYFSAIMNVLEKVRAKKTYNADGFFQLDRKYITKQTTLTESQQIECDTILTKLGIVEVSETNNNILRCDIKTFFLLVTEENISEIKQISKTAKSATKEGKAEGKKAGIITRLLGRVNETDERIFNLYKDLINVCYAKGLQTNEQIDLFQKTLNEYSTDSDVKAEILEISIAAGYRDVNWSITKYNQKHGIKQKQTVGTRIGEQQQTTKVSDLYEF